MSPEDADCFRLLDAYAVNKQLLPPKLAQLIDDEL
jgi:hypothetical protein